MPIDKSINKQLEYRIFNGSSDFAASQDFALFTKRFNQQKLSNSKAFPTSASAIKNDIAFINKRKQRKVGGIDDFFINL